MVMIKGVGVTKVTGKFTKLKGYSKLKIFSHKIDKTWYIREFSSGRELGSANTEANAKKDAREYLGNYKLQEIVDQIISVDTVNEE